MKTLCEQFAEHAANHPERVAISSRGEGAGPERCETTYEELARQSTAFAARLVEAGISRGDRVALLLPNSPEYVAAYLGVLQIGAIAVALNPEVMPAELGAILAASSPRALVIGCSAASTVADLAATAAIPTIQLLIYAGQVPSDARAYQCPIEDFAYVLRNTNTAALPAQPGLDDLAQILYTSGTTGRPKGVTLSHRNIAANCRAIVDVLGLTREDSVFVTLPFFYSYGNSLFFTHLAIGGRLVLADDFVFWNRALDLMQEEQATGFAGVPSSFAMLAHRSDFLKRRFAHLRYVTCAGGALPTALVEQIRAALPAVRLYLMYGQTEATARLSILTPEEWSAKPGSIGRGIPGTTLAVVDDDGRPVPAGHEGEIVARGDGVMAGYWNEPEETARAIGPEGLRSGDLARADGDGYLYIVGRKSELIKSGAYRLHPAEIEEALQKHPGVAEAAVVGIADEIWGEQPVAFVTPTQPEDPVSAKELLEHCRRELPRYKMIRNVRIVSDLPKTSSGKVQRAELRRMASESRPPWRKG